MSGFANLASAGFTHGMGGAVGAGFGTTLGVLGAGFSIWMNYETIKSLREGENNLMEQRKA